MKKLIKYVCVLVIAAITTIIIMYNMASAEGEQDTLIRISSSVSEVEENKSYNITVAFSKKILSGTIKAVCSSDKVRLDNDYYEITGDNAGTSFNFLVSDVDKHTSEDNIVIEIYIGKGGSSWSYETDNGNVTTENELKTTVTITPVKPVETDFTINPTSITVKEGESTNLPTVNPDSVSVNWTIDDGSVAKVENGKVVGLREGNTTLRATADNVTKEASITVEKREEQNPPDTPQPQDFEINPTNIVLKEEESTNLPSVTPPETNVEWTIEDESIAKIENGKVVGKREGSTVLTATANGVSKTANVKINKKDNTQDPPKTDPPKEEPVVDNEPPSIGPTGTTTMYVGEVLMFGADKNVKWTSSNKSVVVIDSSTGKATAVGEGTVTITATADNGKKATAKIVVNRKKEGEKKPETPVISPNTDNTINVGDTYQLSANMEVVWTSSDETVATVDANGLVKGVGGGDTIIYAKSKENRVSSVRITVKGAPAKKGKTKSNTTGNASTENGNSSSTVNEEVPSTGEASTGTLIMLGIITLVVATIVFRKKIK